MGTDGKCLFIAAAGLCIDFDRKYRMDVSIAEVCVQVLM
jgi:hypothetical protein